MSPSLAGTVLALDVDGVLLDPTGHGRGTWQEVIAAQYAVDVRDLQSVFFEKVWPDLVVGRLPIEPALDVALRHLGWAMTTEELLTSWFEADFSPDAEVLDAVRGWADDGARLVLVTNQEHRRARDLNDRLASVLPVDGMAYSAAIGFMKNDPRFFPPACAQLGIDPASPVVFVDDTLGNVETASRFGWTGVHFVRDGPWRAEISSALLSP